MKGPRHRFSREQSAWIATQQLTRPRDGTRRQETPSTQLERVQQHLRDHEERSLERQRARRGRSGNAPVRETGGDPEEEEEEIEEIEEMEEMEEMRIKTENVTAARAAEAPRPLLRTKATADAARLDSERLGSMTREIGVARRTYGSTTVTTTSPILAQGRWPPQRTSQPAETTVSPSAKRQRVETKYAIQSSLCRLPAAQAAAATSAGARPAKDASITKGQALETLLHEAQRESQQWKDKCKAMNAQLASEQSLRKVLQSRLDETLATLQATEKQLQRVEKTSAATSAAIVVGSSGGGGRGGGSSAQAPMAFTIHVNVDVSQNGERVQTSSQTLRVDAGANS